MKLFIWNLQCLISFKLEDLACWVVYLSNRVYNWRLSREAQFPREMVHEAFDQKLEAYLEDKFSTKK